MTMILMDRLERAHRSLRSQRRTTPQQTLRTQKGRRRQKLAMARSRLQLQKARPQLDLQESSRRPAVNLGLRRPAQIKSYPLTSRPSCASSRSSRLPIPVSVYRAPQASMAQCLTSVVILRTPSLLSRRTRSRHLDRAFRTSPPREHPSHDDQGARGAHRISQSAQP